MTIDNYAWLEAICIFMAFVVFMPGTTLPLLAVIASLGPLKQCTVIFLHIHSSLIEHVFIFFFKNYICMVKEGLKTPFPHF